MQGTQLLSLVQEDSTWLRATKLVHLNFRVCVPQLVKSACLEPVLRNKGSHRKEKVQQQRFITIRESPGTQQRPSTATKNNNNNKINIFFKSKVSQKFHYWHFRQIVLYCGWAYLIYWRIFSNIILFYPLDAGSYPSPLPRRQYHREVFGLAKSPLGGWAERITIIKNHWAKDTWNTNREKNAGLNQAGDLLIKYISS